MKIFLVAVVSGLAGFAADGGSSLAAATVRIVMGDSSGAVRAVAPGVLLDRNGSVGTCSSNLFGYSEFQAELANGERYDELLHIGTDIRRGVGVVRIGWAGSGALPLADLETVRPGDKLSMIAMSSDGTASEFTGMVQKLISLSGVRAFEVLVGKQAGSTCGSGAVNEKGELVGIVTSTFPGGLRVIPGESIFSLTLGAAGRPMGSGKALQLGSAADPGIVSENAAKLDPAAWKKNSKTISIRSDSAFMKAESVARELLKLKEFQASGLRILDGPAYGKTIADIEVRISKPLFTSYFNYTLRARVAGVIVGAGRVMAWDGETGAPAIAAKIAGELFGTR